MFAPGANVYSTSSGGDNSVTVATGSSGSAALAAGAAALYLETNRSASPSAVASALIGAATAGVVTGLDGASPNRLLYTGSGSGSGTTETPPPVDKLPTAVISVSCRKLACTFSGSGSSDDHGIAQYSWSFGDGASGAGLTATHTYGASGTFTVKLTVTDTANQSNAATYSLRVSTKGR